MENEYDLIIAFVKSIAKRKLSEWLTMAKEWLKSIYHKAQDLFYKLMDLIAGVLSAISN